MRCENVKYRLKTRAIIIATARRSDRLPLPRQVSRKQGSTGSTQPHTVASRRALKKKLESKNRTFLNTRSFLKRISSKEVVFSVDFFVINWIKWVFGVRSSWVLLSESDFLSKSERRWTSGECRVLEILFSFNLVRCREMLERRCFDRVQWPSFELLSAARFGGSSRLAWSLFDE